MNDEITLKEAGASALDAIDMATVEEDKICIQRDHATGGLSWRFVTPQADPLSLMWQTLFHQMMRQGGYLERIEQLEKRVAELEAKNGKE
jgi:hypothetical protein